MPFARGKEGKEKRTYKLNKVGAKIATYHKLALIIHVETFEIAKYGEYEEMHSYIDKRYYNNPNHKMKSFRYMLYWSDSWLPEALGKMLDEDDREFTGELDYPDTEHLFVDEDVKGLCMSYSGFVVAGDPPLEYWLEKDRREKRQKSLLDDKETAVDDAASEKRRQRSLKAAETMRKKREALALKNGDGKETR